MRTALRVLAVAAAYFVAGKLALLLAIPPGYATAVWPAAGIALAGVLIWGTRIWPGVLVGHFLVNVSTSFDGSTPGAVLLSLPVPLAIAVGGTLQAIAGAGLLRRVGGFPSALDNERDVARFLLLAGPVACLVGASVGVGALVVAGRLQIDAALFSWFTWWVGDSLGVLVVAPLVLVFFAEPRESWRSRRAAVAVPLGLLLVINVALYLVISAREMERIRHEVELSVFHMRDVLRRAVDDHTEVLSSLRDLFAASTSVDRTEFRSFCAGPLARHRGIKALSWNPRVTLAERAEVEAEGGFVIKERDADGALVPAGDRPSYVPVTFIEPAAGNEVAFGYDTASEPTRWRTLEAASRSTTPHATPMITLVQGAMGDRGFLMALAAQSTDGRQRGFLIAVVQLEPLVGEALDGLRAAGVDLAILDVTDRARRERIYGAAPREDGEGLSWAVDLPVAGRSWVLHFQTSELWRVSHARWGAWTFLASGLLFTILLEALLLVITGRTARVDQLVGVRTAELGKVIEDLADSRRSLTLLNELAELLQACGGIGEACAVIEATGRQLFPGVSGAIAVITPSTGVVESKARWGDEPLVPDSGRFLPEECWALRRGQPHLVGDAGAGLVCEHLPPRARQVSLCLPLVALGETLGVLSLAGALGDEEQKLAAVVVKQVSLALGNLKLRETLRDQSVRDPLTGLYNRRFLDESLEREVLRAARHKTPIGLIMIDVDHFKKVNDTYGHEGGDAVLRALGALIGTAIRGGDIACRYGGEELTLILPGASVEVTAARAEKIREMAMAMQVERAAPITVSLGVAAFPDHGSRGADLLQAADAALYRAKREGRNRVVVVAEAGK